MNSIRVLAVSAFVGLSGCQSDPGPLAQPHPTSEAAPQAGDPSTTTLAQAACGTGGLKLRVNGRVVVVVPGSFKNLGGTDDGRVEREQATFACPMELKTISGALLHIAGDFEISHDLRTERRWITSLTVTQPYVVETESGPLRIAAGVIRLPSHDWTYDLSFINALSDVMLDGRQSLLIEGSQMWVDRGTLTLYGRDNGKASVVQAHLNLIQSAELNSGKAKIMPGEITVSSLIEPYLSAFTLEQDGELAIGTGQNLRWRGNVPMKREVYFSENKQAVVGVVEGLLESPQSVKVLGWQLLVSGNARFIPEGGLLAADLPEPQSVILKFDSSSYPVVTTTLSKFIRIEREKRGRFGSAPYFASIIPYQDEMIWADTDSSGYGWAGRSWRSMKDATVAKRSRPYCYVHFLRWQSFIETFDAPFAMGFGPVSPTPCFEGAACIQQFCGESPDQIPTPPLQ